MAKILSIDYGQKRTGFAITDESKIFAFGLTTIPTQTIFTYLKTCFETNIIEKVIIGEPKQMNGNPSESAVFIDEFITKFIIEFPEMPIEKVDERFTSKMAFQSMINSGLNKKQRQNKALIDEIAATIMLQDYIHKLQQRK